MAMLEGFGSTSHLLAAGAACVAGGLIRGFSGFGGGLVLTPLFSLLYGPAVAVPISVLINLLVNVQLIPSSVASTRWRMAAPIAIAACLTAPAGAWLLVIVDADAIRRAIGVTVLVFTIVIAMRWAPAPKGGVVADTIVGVIGGVLNGAAAIGGAPITLYVLGREGMATAKRADLIMIFAVLHVATIVSLHGAGLLTANVLWLSIVLLPIFVLASWAGTVMFRRANDRMFDRVAQVFLIAIGLVSALT